MDAGAQVGERLDVVGAPITFADASTRSDAVTPYRALSDLIY